MKSLALALEKIKGRPKVKEAPKKVSKGANNNRMLKLIGAA